MFPYVKNLHEIIPTDKTIVLFATCALNQPFVPEITQSCNINTFSQIFISSSLGMRFHNSIDLPIVFVTD